MDLFTSVEECHQYLHEEYTDLVATHNVPVLNSPPDSLTFLRKWVMPNKPVIINHAIDHWPALSLWTDDYLRDQVGLEEVTVAVTPDGWADSSLHADEQYHFRLPDEKRLRVEQLLDILQRHPRHRSRDAECEFVDSQGPSTEEDRLKATLADKVPTADMVSGGRASGGDEMNLDVTGVDDDDDQPLDKGIWYIQKQDSNLLREFNSLLPDMDSHISWASEALDRQPDAVNLWLGDERAVSSMHRDHYENLYCVVRGAKLFTLLPPAALPFVNYRKCDVYQHSFCSDTGSFSLNKRADMAPVQWICGPPRSPARPLKVRVSAGQMLYLPALWFHEVQQTHACIAVNYWYDMDYDQRFCYYKFLEATCQLRREPSDLPVPLEVSRQTPS